MRMQTNTVCVGSNWNMQYMNHEVERDSELLSYLFTLWWVVAGLCIIMEQSDYLQNRNGVLQKKFTFLKITFTLFIFFQFDTLIRETRQKHKLPEALPFLV